MNVTLPTPSTMTDDHDDDTVAGLNGEPRRCKATSKRTGERCGAPAVSGRQTCRAHGGTSPRGPAHPSWKHGRYSKLLAHRPAYAEAIQDPTLGQFRETLALFDVRTAELLELSYGVDGEAGLSIVRLRQTWRAVVAAFQTEDPDRLSAALEAHAEEMEGATAAEDAWSELADVLDKRRKAAAAASLAEARSDRTIPAERFDALLSFVLDAAARHVLTLPGGTVALQNLSRDLETIGPKGEA